MYGAMSLLHLPTNSRAAILKKGFILGDTPTGGITRYHLSYFMQKNVYFLESVVVEKEFGPVYSK